MADFKTVVPGQLAIRGQVYPEQLAELAREGFQTVISNRPDEEQAEQPSAAQVRHAAEQHGMSYVHIPVTLDSISRADVEAFHREMSDKAKPAVAHCGSGRRSFLLWAAGQVLFEGAAVDDMMEKGQSLGIDATVLPEIINRVRRSE